MALEPREIPAHYTEQRDVEENFWSMLNIVIPTVSLLFGLELSLYAHFFSLFICVLNAALPLTRFSKICQLLIDAVVVIVVTMQ